MGLGPAVGCFSRMGAIAGVVSVRLTIIPNPVGLENRCQDGSDYVLNPSTMLTIYWFCFAIGGVFVLLAVVSGIDGVEFGAGDFEADVDDLAPDGGMDEDLELADQPTPEPRPLFGRRTKHSPLAIFKSLRFWTFGSCFFGLTGLVLSQLSVGWPPVVIAIAAGVMGVVCGAMVSGMVQMLRDRDSNSLVRSTDLVGQMGVVEIPFDRHSRGKVRLRVKGSVIDRIAYTEDVKQFQPGDTVLVVGTEQDRLWVVSTDQLRP